MASRARCVGRSSAGIALQAAGAACVAVAGFWLLATARPLGAAFTSDFDFRLGVDGR